VGLYQAPLLIHMTLDWVSSCPIGLSQDDGLRAVTVAMCSFIHSFTRYLIEY
jgi:hypothetical protein